MVHVTTDNPFFIITNDDSKIGAICEIARSTFAIIYTASWNITSSVHCVIWYSMISGIMCKTLGHFRYLFILLQAIFVDEDPKGAPAWPLAEI